jgi:hypothetical protein
MKFRKAFIVLMIIVLLSQGFAAGLNPTSADSPSQQDWTCPKSITFWLIRVQKLQGSPRLKATLGIAAEGAEALGDWEVAERYTWDPTVRQIRHLDEAISYY